MGVPKFWLKLGIVIFLPKQARSDLVASDYKAAGAYFENLLFFRENDPESLVLWIFSSNQAYANITIFLLPDLDTAWKIFFHLQGPIVMKTLPITDTRVLLLQYM